MMRLTEKLPKDAIVVEEGLTSTTTLLNYFPFRDRNSFFGNVSGGIGWGIAAAVGVQIAEPHAPRRGGDRRRQRHVLDHRRCGARPTRSCR